ncbi:hypothetical protein [Pseudobacteriovorax antillogorgiicola]|uniref:hypothetical protein n=1 Tax=Pseudobacteriovorax antillogorgiicola TaxID=1513793 RepID=UPI001A9CCD83|nr:hypothetical protein [Pseudobacteriovorax antillogorgiicola]
MIDHFLIFTRACSCRKVAYMGELIHLNYHFSVKSCDPSRSTGLVVDRYLENHVFLTDKILHW